MTSTIRSPMHNSIRCSCPAHGDFGSRKLGRKITAVVAAVGHGRATSFPDGSAGSVRFALEFLAAQRITVAQGTWVSSGAITGVHDVKPGDRVVTRFDGHLQISCSISAAAPTSPSPPSR